MVSVRICCERTEGVIKVRNILLLASCMWLGLPILADNPSRATDTEWQVDMLGRMEFRLTVVCLVVTLIGVVLPIGSMLMQRKSFDRESEIIKKAIIADIEETKRAIEVRFSSLQRDSLCGLDLALSHSVEQFDMMLPDLKPDDGIV